MANGPLRALFSTEVVLKVLLVGALAVGAIHYTGVADVDDYLPRYEWTEKEEIEEERPLIRTGDEQYTGELVNGQVNEIRHNQGLGTVELTRSLAPSPESVGIEPGGVSHDTLLECGGNGAIILTRSEYEARHDTENGVEINANRETVAEDALESAMQNQEQREVILNENWSEHIVDVWVRDHGGVLVAQVFCQG